MARGTRRPHGFLSTGLSTRVISAAPGLVPSCRAARPGPHPRVQARVATTDIGVTRRAIECARLAWPAGCLQLAVGGVARLPGAHLARLVGAAAEPGRDAAWPR